MPKNDKITQDYKDYVSNEIKTKSDDLKRYVGKKISGNFKKDIWLILISAISTAILTGAVTIAVNNYYSEKYVEIVSSHEFNNGNAIIKLYNNAQRHATSLIKIHGKVDGQDKVIKLIDYEILKPQDSQGLTVEIPLAVKNETLPIQKLAPSQSPIECNKRINSWNIPMGKVFESNHLMYRVECEGCKNTEEWKAIYPRSGEVYSSVKNFNDELFLSIQYPHYTWE